MAALKVTATRAIAEGLFGAKRILRTVLEDPRSAQSDRSSRAKRFCSDAWRRELLRQSRRKK
jgi:hypothetical protein